MLCKYSRTSLIQNKLVWMLRNTPLINAQLDMHAYNYCTEECMCMYNYNEHPRIGTHLGPKLHFLIGITTFCSQLCIIVVASWLKVISEPRTRPISIWFVCFNSAHILLVQVGIVLLWVLTVFRLELKPNVWTRVPEITKQGCVQTWSRRWSMAECLPLPQGSISTRFYGCVRVTKYAKSAFLRQ